MEKEIELTLEDLQRYKELQENLYTWVKKFVENIKHSAYCYIDNIYANDENKLLVHYTFLGSTYSIDITFDALLKYIKEYFKANYYGINIAGVEVTSSNYSNITGDGITGFVSYDPNTKTLTLDNATIKGDIRFKYNVKDITITLIGENNVSEISAVPDGTKIINGTGSLTMESIDCRMERGTIIENCTININGFWAMSGSSSELTIKNANIFIESRISAIDNFKDIKLVDCKIAEPINAQIINRQFLGRTNKCIADRDGIIARRVVIKRKRK